MIDDYADEEGASILDEDKLEDADDVFIKRLAVALTNRLNSVKDASSSALNFRQVAQALGEITQDESMVAAIRAERERRLKAADGRLSDARTKFFDILGVLHRVGAVTQAARFAERLAVSDQAKAMVQRQQASERLARATDADNAAVEALKVKTDIATAAGELAAGKTKLNPTYAAYAELNDQDQERIATDALVHYKAALAQHRSDIADAHLDYADRLRSLRDGQNTRLASTITALQGTTPPALPSPNPDAENRGTSIRLRAVR